MYAFRFILMYDIISWGWFKSILTVLLINTVLSITFIPKQTLPFLQPWPRTRLLTKVQVKSERHMMSQLKHCDDVPTLEKLLLLGHLVENDSTQSQTYKESLETTNKHNSCKRQRSILSHWRLDKWIILFYFLFTLIFIAFIVILLTFLLGPIVSIWT